MGIEADSPNKTPEAKAAGYSNELGVDNTVRFLKNISGLWIIQECKRHWADQGSDYDYGALAELALGLKKSSNSVKIAVNPYLTQKALSSASLAKASP